MISKPNFIKGSSYTDTRGTISFTTDFKLPDINRFYTIEHSSVDIVRAWQGHEIETKFFSIIRGKFIIAWVKIDDFDNPSDKLNAEFKVLGSSSLGVLHIPPGYANGLRALEKNSIIAVFSDFDVEKSIEAKRRYNSNKWFNWFQDFDEDDK